MKYLIRVLGIALSCIACIAWQYVACMVAQDVAQVVASLVASVVFFAVAGSLTFGSRPCGLSRESHAALVQDALNRKLASWQ